MKKYKTIGIRVTEEEFEKIKLCAKYFYLKNKSTDMTITSMFKQFTLVNGYPLAKEYFDKIEAQANKQ